MQTATNPQTGEKLVLQNGQWVPMGNAAPAAPGVQTFGTPRPKLPSPQTPTQAATDDVNLEIKRTELGQKAAEERGRNIDRETGIRKEFHGLDPVKQYQTILPLFASALQAGDNGAGDLNIIYALGKVMDPNSAVREGELELASTTGSVGEQLKGYFQQVSRGGRLTPVVRKQLLGELRGRTGAIADAYNQARGNYKGLAGQYGMDAQNIVGAHPGAPFQQVEANFLGRPVNNLDGSQGPAPTQASDDQVQQELKARISGGADPAETIQWLISIGRQPDKATIEAIIANYGNQRPDVRPPEDGPIANSLLNGVGDVVEGLGDIPGLIANPITAGVNLVAGTNFNPDLGQNLRDTLGLPDNGNPMASAAIQGASSALGGAGIARAAAGALQGTGRAVANNLASQPMQQAVGGAGSGAAVQRAEDANLGPVGQLGAGLAGGIAGYGGAAGVANMMEKLGGSPNQLAQAATRQGVDLLPADTGGPVVRRVTGAATQAPFSASPVVKATQKAQEQIGGAASRAAGREGSILPADEAGESVRTAGVNYSRNTAARIGKVYDRAEERAKGVTIKPLNAIAIIDEQLARLGQLGGTNAPLIKSLEKLKNDIAGGVKVSGMRDARTSLSQGVYDGKLRSNQEKAIYKSVVDALSTDIEAGLSAAGRKDALNLFKVADRAWRERVEYIDQILEPIVGGGKSGEDILNAVERMARGKSGGVKRLSGLLSELPEDQAANIRATIVDRLGKARAGQQDAGGEQFSAATFLTRWNEMSPKGKAALFGNGELRRNLDDIAQLANATKQSGKYASFSNTPGGILSNAGIIAATGYASPKAAILAAVVQFGTGHLMASPGFARWLARAPANPKALPSYTARLGQIAAAEPIIANDIKSIQNFLRSPETRAAASAEDQEQDRR